MTFTYSPEDRITSQTQAGVRTDYAFDALGHRYQDKVGSMVKSVRHYVDETDNPVWVFDSTGGGETDVFTPSLGSSLTATRKTVGTATTSYLNISNLHGDTITSLQLPATGWVSGPNELNVFDEYGVKQAAELDNRPAGVTHVDTTSLFVLNYGSLGGAGRETTDTGIQFMGARGYNPITGQFLTPDPVQGGNETPYNYPNDPINKNDIGGLMGLVTHVAIGIAATWAAGILLEGLCVAFVFCGLIEAVAVGVVAGVLAGGFESGMDRVFHGSKEPNKPVSDSLTGAASGMFDASRNGYLKTTKKFRNLPTAYHQEKFLKGASFKSGIYFDTAFKLYDIATSLKPNKPFNWFEELIF